MARPVLVVPFLVALLLSVTGLRAEEVVTLLSDETIFVDTDFDGARLTLAGEIRPGHGVSRSAPLGPYHVVAVVRGPGETRVVWGAEPVLGVWLKTRSATFADVPGFYWVLASGRLDSIVSPDSPSRSLLTSLPPTPGEPSPAQAEFAPELQRLMRKEGLYGVDERGVVFRSERFFTAQLTLPTFAPTGLYVARTYVLNAQGIVVARHSQSFSVRVVGFERLLAVTARMQPFLYGAACVALALVTGWLGGVVFKR